MGDENGRFKVQKKSMIRGKAVTRCLVYTLFCDQHDHIMVLCYNIHKVVSYFGCIFVCILLKQRVCKIFESISSNPTLHSDCKQRQQKKLNTLKCKDWGLSYSVYFFILLWSSNILHITAAELSGPRSLSENHCRHGKKTRKRREEKDRLTFIVSFPAVSSS